MIYKQSTLNWRSLSNYYWIIATERVILKHFLKERIIPQQSSLNWWSLKNPHWTDDLWTSFTKPMISE